MMTARAEQLLADALRLPPGERAQLAELLFSSLDISQDKLDRLWTKEAYSRIDAYEDGQIKTISSSQVFKHHLSRSDQTTAPATRVAASPAC